MQPLSPAGAFVLALTMIRNNLNVGTLPLLSSVRVRQETRNYIVIDNNQLNIDMTNMEDVVMAVKVTLLHFINPSMCEERLSSMP